MPLSVLPLLILPLIAPADGPAAGGSPTRASIRWSTPRPFRVGQVVEGSVEVDGRPIPARPIAEGTGSASAGELTWIDPGAPGDPVRAVFWKPGRVTIPPGRFEVGGRVVVTPRSTVEVVAVPAERRPASFLGGIGPFSAASSADRASVGLGESFRATISVDGPAAVGSLSPLADPGWSSVEVKRLPGPIPPMPRVVDASAFRREYAYMVRPTRPGRIVLAPVAISAFDPSSGTYQTRYSPGIEVKVRPAPRVDPASIHVAEVDPSLDRRSIEVAAVGVVAIGLAAAWWSRRSLSNLPARMLRGVRARRDDPRQVARRCLRWLGAANLDDRAVRALAGWIDRWASAQSRRPISAVAAVDIARMVDRGLVDQATASSLASLVEAADRVRFSGRSRPSDRDRLMLQARATFEGLARRHRSPGENPRLP